MSSSDDRATDELPTGSPQRRFYAYCDDGHWMEMTCWNGDGRPTQRVTIYEVEATSDEDFRKKADDWEGTSLGFVQVVNDRPILHTECPARWISPEEPLSHSWRDPY